MHNPHAVVWLDHREAKIFQFSPEHTEEEKVLAVHHHVRHSQITHEPRLDTFEHHFFRDIVAGLGDAREVLVVGPGIAKLAFITYVHKHAHDLVSKIVGVETIDHPTDRQIVAYARKYFRGADQMLGESDPDVPPRI